MMKTIEEKAKAYDEAIERARIYIETDKDNTMQVYARRTMEYLFPELEESKDEKIRKALISVLKSDFEKDTTIHGITVNDILAWLEKQKSEEEFWPNLANCIHNCKKCWGKCFYRKEDYQEQNPIE